MRAPDFWHHGPNDFNWRASLLAPLGWAYARATAHRLAKSPGFKAAIPVICIGNINAGGTGKTPTAIALSERLAQRGRRVIVVTRGYGGKFLGPVVVDPSAHHAAEVGDEALLLCHFATTIVAKDRAAGVRLAQSLCADVVLLDDGFQNPSVHKDLCIVVVDAEQGFGNGRCIPAGPLREPLQTGLGRANFVLSVGPQGAQTKFRNAWAEKLNVPHLVGSLEPLAMGMDWSNQRVVAFAGIGRPEKFFETLRGLGAHLVKTESLADHQTLPNRLLQRLAFDAFSQNAQLVTTEKDAARLPLAFRQKVLTLVVRLRVYDWGPLDLAISKLGL